MLGGVVRNGMLLGVVRRSTSSLLGNKASSIRLCCPLGSSLAQQRSLSSSTPDELLARSKELLGFNNWTVEYKEAKSWPKKPIGLGKAEEIQSHEDWVKHRDELKDYKRTSLALRKESELKREVVRKRRKEYSGSLKAKRNAYLGARAARREKLEAEQKASGLEWEVEVAVMLERLPQIIPDFEPWEAEYNAMKQKYLVLGPAWAYELGVWDPEPLEPKPIDQILAECPVPLAPRVTEEDKTNDRTSLNRRLAHRIFLIVRDGSETAPWQFLQSPIKHKDGEVLRKASERTLQESLPPGYRGWDPPHFGFESYHVGNGPAGYIMTAYDEEERKKRKAFGKKVFLTRCQMIGDVPPPISDRWKNQLWVTKEEMGEYFGEELGVYFKLML